VENEPSGFILPDNPGLTARALLGPLIADAPIGLALVDDKFRYVFINETQAGFNELPVAEHLGKTVRKVLGDVTWAALEPFFRRSLSGQSLRAHEVTHVSLHLSGVRRHYLVSFYPVRSDRRTVTGVGTVITDITERTKSEALIAGQNRILEGIATDIPLVQTLTSVAELIEAQFPDVSALVLQTQKEGGRLMVAAAPRFSVDNALQIWESLQSCLASVVSDGADWTRTGVVTPLTSEDFGSKFPDESRKLPLACWMSPILGEKAEVLGAFCLLLQDNREPTPRESTLVDSAVHTARIAIERDRELVRRRHLLRDMLGSLTEGRLVLCLAAEDLPVSLAVSHGEPMILAREVLRDLRRNVTGIAEELGMPDDRRYDLEVAVGEAAMNAVVHAETGTGEVFSDSEHGRIQVWIRDAGIGIAEESLHRATLERGYSTGGTLGHGFWMILKTIDKVYLLTGPDGTTIVLEHSCESPDEDWTNLI
jgi:anti-sigma regulatory factor (Ser/Thr protein kinase)